MATRSRRLNKKKFVPNANFTISFANPLISLGANVSNSIRRQQGAANGGHLMRTRTVFRSCLLLASTLAGAAALPAVALAQTAPPAAPSPSPTPTPVSSDKPVRTLSGTLTPYVGNIRTFTGDIDPKIGNIRTFSGDLGPYIGNIRTFNGDVNPYIGNIRTFWGDLAPKAGDLDPTIGNIRTFSDSFNAASKDALGLWLNLDSGATAADYATVASKIGDLIAQGKAAWGAQVSAKKGKSFEDAFANPMLAKYGINLSDPSSLANLDLYSRQMFFLDWYDQLMEYSGYDHVDHWMKEINWSPAVTKTIGEGKRSTIGLLDFTVTGDGAQNVTKYDGISTFSNGHGAAVASLMIAKHDGHGVMGIAPMASVVAYNPFDASGTANWTDVKNGVLMLAQNNASIVNMSLGEPGWTLPQGWNDVFGDAAVSAYAKKSIFVIAAGNDGITQTQNIAWDKSNPYMIVVGSVGPDGTISSFSNRPGTACLLKGNKCDKDGALMNRFITAPGEMILVSDGQGGVTRVSGTSFAAPLVSGTIALLHDRWPWLANYPKESVDIILQSARDVGAPGVDPVYGWGILDVTAALSPLNFANLKWYQYDDKGRIVSTQANKIRDPKEQAKWEAAGMFFYAYEDIGATFRDFAIPVSSKLVDGTATSLTGSTEYLQSYIYSRFMAWATATKAGGSGKGFTGFAFSAPIPNRAGLQLSMAVAPRSRTIGFRQSNVPYQTAVRLETSRMSFTFGEGDGAVQLGGGSFGMASDFDPATGGANPLMGFASGGGYLETNVRVGKHWSVSTGLTQRVLRRDLRQLDMLSAFAMGSVDPYSAGAQHISVRYETPSVSVAGTYTRLREKNAMLGIESLDPNDFADGTTTDGMSLASQVELSPTLTMAATGTISRTASSKGSAISPSAGGLVSSSFQVGLTKRALFGKRDLTRLTLAQPMHLENGTIDLRTVQVIDRQTGELGPVTQRLNLGVPERQYVSELMYGRSLLDGAAQFSLFGRATLNGRQTQQLPRFTAGAAFQFAF